MISNNLAIYSYLGAHRFIPSGALVVMVVRFAELRGAGEIRRDRWTYLVLRTPYS
jgi:hypothetical protein